MSGKNGLNPYNSRHNKANCLPSGHAHAKIARSTGFSIGQLKKLEKALNFYIGRPEKVTQALSSTKMPTARQLMVCLFLNSKRNRNCETETGRESSELHFCVNSSMGRLVMIARMTIEKRARLFGPSEPVARLRVAYKLLSSEGESEFLQEIILSGNSGFRVRKRNEKTLAKTSKSQDQTPLLLPDARAVYL